MCKMIKRFVGMAIGLGIVIGVLGCGTLSPKAESISIPNIHAMVNAAVDAVLPIPTPTIALPMPTPTITLPMPTPIVATTEPAMSVYNGETGYVEEIRGDDALRAYDSGANLYDAGKYHEAIAAFQMAQELHGGPLYTAENRIALAYIWLGDYQTAIHHATLSIGLKDRTAARHTRAQAYASLGDCELAMGDSGIVLDDPVITDNGIHMSVMSHGIMTWCHPDVEVAMGHIADGLQLARDYQYQDRMPDTYELLVVLQAIVQAEYVGHS